MTTTRPTPAERLAAIEQRNADHDAKLIDLVVASWDAEEEAHRETIAALEAALADLDDLRAKLAAAAEHIKAVTFSLGTQQEKRDEFEAEVKLLAEQLQAERGKVIAAEADARKWYDAAHNGIDVMSDKLSAATDKTHVAEARIADLEAKLRAAPDATAGLTEAMVDAAYRAHCPYGDTTMSDADRKCVRGMFDSLAAALASQPAPLRVSEPTWKDGKAQMGSLYLADEAGIVRVRFNNGGILWSWTYGTAEELEAAKRAAVSFAAAINGATVAPERLPGFEFPALRWGAGAGGRVGGTYDGTAWGPSASAGACDDGKWRIEFRGTATSETDAEATVERLHALVTGRAVAQTAGGEPPVTDAEARECVERLGIDVPKWAAEVRAKVAAAAQSIAAPPPSPSPRYVVVAIDQVNGRPADRRMEWEIAREVARACNAGDAVFKPDAEDYGSKFGDVCAIVDATPPPTEERGTRDRATALVDAWGRELSKAESDEDRRDSRAATREQKIAAMERALASLAGPEVLTVEREGMAKELRAAFVGPVDEVVPWHHELPSYRGDWLRVADLAIARLARPIDAAALAEATNRAVDRAEGGQDSWGRMQAKHRDMLVEATRSALEAVGAAPVTMLTAGRLHEARLAAVREHGGNENLPSTAQIFAHLGSVALTGCTAADYEAGAEAYCDEVCRALPDDHLKPWAEVSTFRRSIATDAMGAAVRAIVARRSAP